LAPFAGLLRRRQLQKQKHRDRKCGNLSRIPRWAAEFHFHPPLETLKRGLAELSAKLQSPLQEHPVA
jgi:hypothetical protein